MYIVYISCTKRGRGAESEGNQKEPGGRQVLQQERWRWKV